MIWRRKNPEKTKHLRGLLRVAAYFSCATLVCSVVSIRHARAEYQDSTLVFGKQMLDLAQASNHEVTKIIFNGQPIHVGSSVTQDDPDAVLKRYEGYCKSNRGQSAGDFSDIEKQFESAGANPKKLAEAPAAPASNDAPEITKAGFVRSGSEGEGAVMCFVKGAKTKTTTKAAFESFMTTGELGSFGELRYAYASKGPSGKTLVLTVWTDSTFNLRDMVGEADKDCPGEDFPEIPRVPASTRVMSARADGAPFGINVYKSTDSPKKTLEYYDAEMKKAGWFTFDPEMNEERDKGLGRSYMKNAVVVTLGTSVQPEGNFVAVGLSGVAKDESKLGAHR